MHDLIVIGAGPGGYEAALHAARLGKSVLLAEKQYLGGTCLNVGCIPTKSLLHAAHLFELAQQAGEAGVVIQGKPSFDMAVAARRKNQVVGQLTRGVGSLLQSAKVEVVMGAARLVAPGKVEVAGKTYETRNVLIATGSRPARPPIPGLDSPSVRDSTGILELESIPPRLAIIGAGVIGLEFASLFASVGSKVHVVEMLDRVAPGADLEVAAALQKMLKKRGVEFSLAAKVKRIAGGTLHYERGGQELSLEADCILSATGRAPVVQGLGLEDLKVDFSPKGIRSDERSRTNVPGVWACGDVTGRCLLAHAAVREGQVAVNNMFGQPDRMSYRAMPCVIYTHPEVAWAGLTEEEARERSIEFTAERKPLRVAGRYLIECDKEPGFCKVIMGARHREVLGVHIIGARCSEMIWGAAALIEAELRAPDIAKIIFPHPTVSEAIKDTLLAH